MQEEQQMTEKQSLDLINEMIGKAKQSYITEGKASIVWGALIIFCSLMSWAQYVFKFSIGFDVWLLLIVALGAQIFYSVREKKNKKVKIYGDQAMSYVWTTFGICIFMMIFYANVTKAPNNIFLIMTMYGVPTFITGGIFKFKSMIFGGIACWVLAIITLYVPFSTGMLLMALSGLLAWLIPGIICQLRYQKNKEKHV